MKEIILKELENWKDLQPNMASETLRESLADKIAKALSENGFAKVFLDYEPVKKSS